MSLQQVSLNALKKNAESKGLRLTLASGQHGFDVPKYTSKMRLIETVGPFALVKPIIVTLQGGGWNGIFEYLAPVKLKTLIKDARIPAAYRYELGRVDYFLDADKPKIIGMDIGLDEYVTKDAKISIVWVHLGPYGARRARSTITRGQHYKYNKVLQHADHDMRPVPWMMNDFLKHKSKNYQREFLGRVRKRELKYRRDDALL